MSWKINYTKRQPDFPKVGDMWECKRFLNPKYREYYRKEVLSEMYYKEWGGIRYPLYVLLPDGTEFCLDGKDPRDGIGWKIRGTFENITVAPSINIIGGYHGFIQNGIITDDCGGKTFDKNYIKSKYYHKK